MSYKLTQRNQVIRISDGAILPVQWVNGVPIAEDAYSPLVKEFGEWVDAGNVPLPADDVAADVAVGPTLEDIIGVLRADPALNAKLDAQVAMRTGDMVAAAGVMAQLK